MVPVFGLVLLGMTWFLQQNTKPSGYDGSTGMLQAGQWLRNTSIPSDWQPQDCTFRIYDTDDIKQCLPPNSTLIFFGDSTVRKVFWSTAHLMDSGIREDGNIHTNTHFIRHNITIHLFWDPYLNSTHSRDVLARMANGTQFLGNQTYIYASTGLWHANFDHRDRVLHGYKNSVDDFVDMIQTAIPGSLGTVYFAPTMLPYFEKMDVMRNSKIKPYYLDRMHAYANQKFGYNPDAPLGSPGNDGVIYSNTTGEPLAYYVPVFNKIGLGHDLYDDVGTHYTLPGTEMQAQILLNHFCNPRIINPSTFPHTQSCRVHYNPPSSIHQLLTFLMFVFGAGLVVFTLIPTQRFGSQPMQAIFAAGLISVITTLYAFVCDRTHEVNKAFNILSWYELFVLSQLLIVVCALTLSRGRVVSHLSTQFLAHPALNAEWKGLAIGIWLISKVSGYAHDYYAGQVLCHILETSLLFAETYGFAIATMAGDVDMRTVCAQLLRINVLPVLFAWALETSYYFYVIPFKITFWTLFVFIGFGMLGGNGVAALASRLVKRDMSPQPNQPNIMSDMLRLAIMTTISRLFVIPLWDTLHKDVTAQFGLDLYLEFWIGVIAVALAAVVTNPPLMSAINEQIARPQVRNTLLITSLLGGLYLCNVTLISGAFQSAEHYSSGFHVVASLGFVYFYMMVRASLLRDAKDSFIFSGAFEFLGNCWLEMIVMSFHTLLAGDGTMRLFMMTTGNTQDSPYAVNTRRTINFLVLMALFLTMSWRLALAWEELATGGGSTNGSSWYEVADTATPPNNTSGPSVSPYTLELYALEDEETGMAEVKHKRAADLETSSRAASPSGSYSSMEDESGAFKEAKQKH